MIDNIAHHFQSTPLKGVTLIEWPIHRDVRGEYFEYYNEQEFKFQLEHYNRFYNKSLQFPFPLFVQDAISTSRQHVLRGFHGSFDGNWKLVQCLYGEIYSVIMDNNKDSDQYLQWASFILSDKNRQQLLIAPGMGNSILVMSNYAIYHYKQTQPYKGPNSQFTLKYNDPKIRAVWPIQHPILSERDANAQLL